MIRPFILLVLFTLSLFAQEIPPAERFWIHVANGTASGSVTEAFIQQTHENNPNSPEPFGIAGVLVLSDGRRIAIVGHFLSAPTDLPVVPPAPIATSLAVSGDLTTPSALQVTYTYLASAGVEGATTIVWTQDGTEVGTGQTFNWTKPGTIRVTVTPVADTGAVGQPVSIDVTTQLPPSLPPPSGTKWGVPAFWPSILAKPHPRSYGPVNGPHPHNGPYLDVVTPGNLTALRNFTTTFNPTQPRDSKFANYCWAAARALPAVWLKDRTPEVMGKITTFLNRSFSSDIKDRYFISATCEILDHVWDDIEPAFRAQIVDALFVEGDLRRTNDRAGVGFSDSWEGWQQFGIPEALVQIIIVCYDPDDSRWVRLADWFGEKWYSQHAPAYWAITVGDHETDGLASWGNETYYKTQLACLYHTYLALTVATGHDHFMVPEHGGWFGRTVQMQRHRMTPMGSDVAFGKQGSWWYNFPYAQYSPGLNHHTALAYATGDPTARWESWANGNRDPQKFTILEGDGPWFHFVDPTLERTPPTEWSKVGKFQQYLTVHTGWSEIDAMAGWTRGDTLCHHTMNQPGHFIFIGRGGPQGVGGWLLSHGALYGFGSDVVVTDGSYAGYNGLLFFHAEDKAHTEKRPLFTAPGVKPLVAYLGDGAGNVKMNPWHDRLGQDGHPKGLYDDFQSRRAELNDSDPITYLETTINGVEVTAESLDWSPAFTDYWDGSAVLDYPEANSRVTRGRWFRGIAFLNVPGQHPAMIVLDRADPSPGTRVEYQLRPMEAPAKVSDGLWHFTRTKQLQAKSGKWQHLRTPKSHFIAPDKLRVHGELWIRHFTNEAPTTYALVAGGPTAPFSRSTISGEIISLQGVSQYPLSYGGAKVLWQDSGPDEYAPWLWLVRPSPAPQYRFALTLTSGPQEYPTVVVPGGVRVQTPVGPITVTLSETGVLAVE